MLLYFLGGLENGRSGAELVALLALVAAQSFVTLLHFRTAKRTTSLLPDYVFALPVLAFIVLFVPVFATSWIRGVTAAGSGLAGLSMLFMFRSGFVQVGYDG